MCVDCGTQRFHNITSIFSEQELFYVFLKKIHDGETLDKKKRLCECYGKYRKQMGIDKQ